MSSYADDERRAAAARALRKARRDGYVGYLLCALLVDRGHATEGQFTGVYGIDQWAEYAKSYLVREAEAGSAAALISELQEEQA